MDGAPFVVDLLGEHRSVVYAGQPIAAVAAETLAEARRLAADFPIEITPKPFVTDAAAAKADGAAVVFPDQSRSQDGTECRRGRVVSRPVVRQPAWAGDRPIPRRDRQSTHSRRPATAATLVLAELELGTAMQLHTSFEPHCTVADWSDPAKLRVWTSTQGVHLVHEELAEHYGLDPSAIELNADFVGGGFGAKLAITPDMHGAIQLSKKARRPVRLVLDRREELTATGNRPGSVSNVSLLVGDDNSYEALVMNNEAHAGSGINGAYGVVAALTYRRAPKMTRDTDVVTNTPPGAPFRGPGGPTAAWALESTVDQAAHQLGRDPIDVRRGLDKNPKRIALYDWAQDLDLWKSRRSVGADTGRFRRGVGVAAANWMYMLDPATEVEVAVENGQLVVSIGTQDMGTGSKTVMAKAVAEVFDIEPSEVTVRMGVVDGKHPSRSCVGWALARHHRSGRLRSPQPRSSAKRSARNQAANTTACTYG